MTDADLETLLSDLETDRVERKESDSKKKEICQAICAFANDLPGHRVPGFLFIGVSDKGQPTGLPITDKLLLDLAAIRSDGNIQPLPMMSVEKRTLKGKEVAIISVEPSYSTPVRFEGRVWIRVGPRRALATPDEERRLTEKRRAADLPFDEQPVRGAALSDLSLTYFKDSYLPRAVADDVIRENQRSIEHQMASLRFLTTDLATPTVAGLLVVGNDPLMWVPGAFVQLVRFEGETVTAPIRNQKRFLKRLEHVVEGLDAFLPFIIETARVSNPGTMQHEDVRDYPVSALRELVFNAIMHRNYATSNAPVQINWFANRVEISNPGGLYGRVTKENFERTTDYRNPAIAEAMRALRYVERYGIGIARVKAALAQNGNPPPEFRFEPETTTVTIWRRGESG